MHKTCIDTYVKTLGESTRFSRVCCGETSIIHRDDTTTFITSFKITVGNLTQTYTGCATFPHMIVDDKIMELWLTSIYLHALNLQPITESKILPPNGLSKQSIEFCDDLYTHNYQIWHNIFGRTTDLTNSITNYK